MILKYVTIGTIEPIEITLVDLYGDTVDGLSGTDLPKLHIRKMSDNTYYNFNDNEFVTPSSDSTGFPTGTEAEMSQPDSSRESGKYQVNVYLDPVAFTAPDSYSIRVTCSYFRAGNAPMEGEIKTQYASFDETVMALEETDIVPAAVDIEERRVQRGMPSIIRKKLSDSFWVELKLWYDYEGGQIIKTTSEIVSVS